MEPRSVSTAPGWSGGPSTFSYLWSRCAADGTACTAIPGATGATYAVAAGDVGSTLQVTVTGGNTVGARPASSAVTTPVA